MNHDPATPATTPRRGPPATDPVGKIFSTIRHRHLSEMLRVLDEVARVPYIALSTNPTSRSSLDSSNDCIAVEGTR